MVQPAEVDAAILAYYARGREKARLEASCRLEFLRTQELLTRFLPRPPASIVDVGGGAGIHAVPLIAAGYGVALVDPVELHVEQARASGVERAWVGDARTLPIAGGHAGGGCPSKPNASLAVRAVARQEFDGNAFDLAEEVQQRLHDRRWQRCML